jgi:hypothetical protein
MYYGIRVYPYTHPQLIKVLKHFVYIQYGCGIQSMGVCSLNHDTTTSYRLSHTPFFLKLPHLHMYYGIRVYPYAHPQLIKVLKHFVYIQYRGGIQSMGVCSLNHDTTTSYRLSHTPFFLKLPPPAHVLRHKGVPICPSTAYQGAKSLCIQMICMWDTVNGGLQPQP